MAQGAGNDIASICLLELTYEVRLNIGYFEAGRLVQKYQSLQNTWETNVPDKKSPHLRNN